MTVYSIVETDNYGGDYPNEKFLFRWLRKEAAEEIASVVNKYQCPNGSYNRYWKVVEDSFDKQYKLLPGFEP